MSAAGQKKSKDPYRDSLNLPQTDFAMRANLAQNEPKAQKRWLESRLFERIHDARKDAPAWTFHDGPPYANGAIHMGHLLNKVLKDLVVRSKTMTGHRVDYVPGWDCHGLPIEHKVLKELGKAARSMSTIEIRKKCEADARKYVELQGGQMKRLGTSARYAKPYLTMNSNYEAGVLEVFSEMLKEGIVYRDLKPVHWSITNQTALAEAELEYQDRKDLSVFVNFEISTKELLPTSLNASSEKVHFMIWTTTPWTLPANLAIAAAPRGNYGLYRAQQEGKSILCIVVEDLAEKVFAHAESFEKLGRCTGQELADAKLRYHHPFMEQERPLLLADYVTFEDGTGLVHTAPGHGADDYQTGLKNKLEVYCPVKADGRYDESVPAWLQGLSVWDGNEKVAQHLKDSGHLFHSEYFMHSYPHDWRSKTPTIFRATEQWFVAVDKPLKTTDKSLRDMALHATDNEIEFIPKWGRSRFRGMLETRPDWCISRQRTWGLPIPAFILGEGQALLTEKSLEAVTEKIRSKGSDTWFESEAKELLEHYDWESDPERPSWLNAETFSQLKRGGDIFDVWFESGSSWNAVLKQRNLGFPSELYLEGSDQHRGWFQLSLLPALAAMKKAPFKTILTHGFLVDSKGKKMSKSLGNAIEVDKLLQQYGADICRWWVCGLNTANDIKVDWAYFKTASEEYRKIRNTLRFLMGNLADFDAKVDLVELGPDDGGSVDAWAYDELQRVISECRSAYDELNFKAVRETLFHFCNEELSAVYMAATKDRLYCEAKDSPKRRRTQSVLFACADTLIHLLAPVLVHTADEAYLALHGHNQDDGEHSVHIALLPTPQLKKASQYWPQILELRQRVLKVMEDSKATLGVSNPMEMGLEIQLDSKSLESFQPYAEDFADLCGVSLVNATTGTSEKIDVLDLRNEPRCARSWKRDGTVKERSDGGMLSDRDAEILGL